MSDLLLEHCTLYGLWYQFLSHMGSYGGGLGRFIPAVCPQKAFGTDSHVAQAKLYCLCDSGRSMLYIGGGNDTQPIWCSAGTRSGVRDCAGCPMEGEKGGKSSAKYTVLK